MKSRYPILVAVLLLSACQTSPTAAPNSLSSPQPTPTPTPLERPTAVSSPVPTPVSSSTPPTSTPKPSSSSNPAVLTLDLTENVQLQQFSHRDSYPFDLVQGVLIDEQGNGQVVWQNPVMRQLQGIQVQQYQPESQIKNFAPLDQVSIRGFQQSLGPTGQKLMAWSTDNVVVAGWPDPPTLSSFSQTTESVVITHGLYRVHHLSVNAQGNGNLLVSTERERGGASFGSVYEARGSSLLRIPVKNWKVDLSPIKTGPWLNRLEQEDSLPSIMRFPPFGVNEQVIKTVSLDDSGTGAVVYQKQTDKKIYWSKIENFKAQADKQLLAVRQDVFYKSGDFRLTLKDGAGSLTWLETGPEGGSLHVMPVLDGQLQPVLVKPFLSQFLDYALNSDGRGLAVWTEKNEQGLPVLKLQMIKDFVLVKTTYVMSWPNQGTEVISAKLGLNAQGDGLLSFATGTCTWNGTSCQEVGRPDVSIWTRQISGFKPQE